MAFPKRIGCLLNLPFRPSGALRVMLDGHRCLTNAQLNSSDAVSEGWEVQRGRHVLGWHPFGIAGLTCVRDGSSTGSY